MTLVDVSESSVPLVILIAFYFVGCGLSLANYVGFFRYHSELYGTALIRAHCAFAIIGLAGYLGLAATSWLWSAKYASSSVNRRIGISVGFFTIFISHDLPLFIIEWTAITWFGWRHGLQGFVFIVQFGEFLLSFTFAWLSYAHLISGYLQTMFASPVEATLKTGAENLSILPPADVLAPLPIAEPMMGRTGGPEVPPPPHPPGYSFSIDDVDGRKSGSYSPHEGIVPVREADASRKSWVSSVGKDAHRRVDVVRSNSLMVSPSIQGTMPVSEDREEAHYAHASMHSNEMDEMRVDRGAGGSVPTSPMDRTGSFI